MKRDEMAKRAAELERRLEGLLEMIEKLPPTLPQAVELHAMWLRKEKGGVQLDLSGRDLRKANLKGVNLTGADLSGAILDGTDLGKAASASERLLSERQQERGGRKPGRRP